MQSFVHVCIKNCIASDLKVWRGLFLQMVSYTIFYSYLLRNYWNVMFCGTAPSKHKWCYFLLTTAVKVACVDLSEGKWRVSFRRYINVTFSLNAFKLVFQNVEKNCRCETTFVEILSYVLDAARCISLSSQRSNTFGFLNKIKEKKRWH